MRVLIIEDEEAAARRLQKMLREVEPGWVVETTLESVKAAIEWYSTNEAPDLSFMDIHLADGLSLELFKHVEISNPVIFTTAYDEYALKAFKINTIDYLLKPIKQNELQDALAKYKKLHAAKAMPIDMKLLLQTFQQTTPQYKNRFVIKYGEHIKTVEIKDTAYFYTESKACFLITNEQKKYVIDFNLDQLETVLDPKQFFRINRQFIIGIHAIDEMITYSKSRVFIKLKPATKMETIVSAERAAEFKLWLNG